MTQTVVPAHRASRVPHFGWLGIAGLVVAVALVAAAAGYVISENRSAPVNTDQALIDDVAAAWSTTADPATIAALYTTDAIFHDTIGDETSTGLAEMQAKNARYATVAFKVVNTSAPIRQGDFVAWFGLYGRGEATEPMLLVVRTSGGRIAEQWVYPAA